MTAEDASHVRLDKNGNIDRAIINAHSSESGNYKSLKELVNSSQVVEVSTNDQFRFIDENGNHGKTSMKHLPYDSRYYNPKDSNGDTMSGTTTGEEGFLGKTLFPDRDGKQNSPNENIKVVIHKKLSVAAKAEMYSHEMNGHALLYIKNGGNHIGASHQVSKGLKDNNIRLKNMIIRPKKETINNMKTK
ncbi:hypothetical protein OAT16_02040 [Prolixibacteraceae bacterium]|nr:hypothetical protein [Prolixibacteraceae bacterium]